jgi:hypothetical protein
MKRWTPEEQAEHRRLWVEALRSVELVEAMSEALATETDFHQEA